jgi:hypothetical protein
MCDKRTASRLSNFNSAKRKGLSAQNLKHMAQLYDHWTYGLDAPKSKHSANIQLPKARIAATAIHLPSPTLQDLLNPNDDSSEDPKFIFDDPYGAKFLADSDDDSNSDNKYVPIITRGALERLEIDNLIDLSNSKLVARYSESSSLHPAAAVQSAKPTRRPTTASAASEWTNQNWAAKDADW